MLIVPKNWASFQHYKDRNPPWIKLHKDLLDDRAFQRLPIASRALAPMLWLLASESKDGSFKGSVEELAFRLRTSEKEIDAGLKPLIANGFFLPVQDASNALADDKQVAPESCSETEAERETKTEAKREGAVALLLSKEIPEPLARDFLAIRKAKKAPLTETALAGIEREAAKAGYTLQKALETCCARSWQGFEAVWVQPKPGSAEAKSMTVPGPTERDPALKKLDEDAKKTAGPSLETLAAMAEARKKFVGVAAHQKGQH